MKYDFSFYKQSDFDEIEEMILNSYKWDYPFWSLSRQEFVFGLHPDFTGHYHAHEHTIGVYRQNGKIVACVMNEGNYDGEAFFLFDSKERAFEKDLLCEMIRYAKTNCSAVKDWTIRHSTIYAPTWNTVLKELLVQNGFTKTGWNEKKNILSFENAPFEVKLPEGYSFADGNTTPDFYLSNTHRISFGYGKDDYACEHGAKAFHELRKMKHYQKDLDICVLDPYKRPVAFGIIWYDEKMPYCELEPLAVCWWERRKGIATALLHELSNRVKAKYPNCIGMNGGDQPFYFAIGYETKAEQEQFHWEKEVLISWDERSKDKFYKDYV